jgi:hypothetical protein
MEPETTISVGMARASGAVLPRHTLMLLITVIIGTTK